MKKESIFDIYNAQHKNDPKHALERIENEVLPGDVKEEKEITKEPEPEQKTEPEQQPEPEQKDNSGGDANV